MELELNSLDWNANELEIEIELEDMKHTKGKLNNLSIGYCNFNIYGVF